MHFLAFIFVLFVATSYKDIVESVRMIELRVAGHMAEGTDALLGCSFDMEDDTLYSLKWYKDGHEFYRFVPKARPPTKVFFVPGVVVDLNRSSTNFVALKALSRESGGVYRCEVYGEGPHFTTVSREKHVEIDLLPTKGPIISGLQGQYHDWSELNLNCTTTPSRPEAHLVWFVNGSPAPKQYLGRPILVLPSNHPHTYQSKLNLHFTVYRSHYINGVLSIRCQATIPPLYHQETEYTFYDQPPLTSEPTPYNVGKGRVTAQCGSISVLIALSVFLIFVSL